MSSVIKPALQGIGLNANTHPGRLCSDVEGLAAMMNLDAAQQKLWMFGNRRTRQDTCAARDSVDYAITVPIAAAGRPRTPSSLLHSRIFCHSRRIKSHRNQSWIVHKCR